MTCDQCPFVIPCWGGVYFRSVCKCGNGVMHQSLAVSYVIVRCPRPSPVPANKEHSDQPCPDCDLASWKGYKATNVCPGLDYYNMEMDEANFINFQGTPFTREAFEQTRDRLLRQPFQPTRYILFWSDSKDKTKT